MKMMHACAASVVQAIVDTPDAEATFFSLPYVAALQQCAAQAYEPALATVATSTGCGGFSGDCLGERIARTRLETERSVAAQLRTALLREQTSPRLEKKDGPPHATIEEGGRVAGAASSSPVSTNAAVNPPGRRRASSVVVVSNNASGKASRRASRKPSLGVGPGESGASGAGAADAGGSPSTSPRENTAETAVQLLREGLCRALGWLPTTTTTSSSSSSSSSSGKERKADTTSAFPTSRGTGSLTSLADTLLSRRSFPPTISATEQHSGTVSSGGRGHSASPAISAHLYMELNDADQRRDALLEWMEDLLIFALCLNFTAAQTQCLLLDAMVALQMLEVRRERGEKAASGDGVAWEERLAEALQDALCTQTCQTATRVVELVQQRRPVVREVPDPVQLAEWEQKRLKATTQKALAAVEAAQSGIPLITQTVMEDVSVEVERDATLPAIFTMAEAASVVEFITRSAVMHGALWRVVLADVADAATQRRLRPAMEAPLVAYVEDVPPVFVPPLASFYPSRLQDEMAAQRSVYDDCAAQKADAYCSEYEKPCAATMAAEAQERQALTEAAWRATAEDRDAALTTQECAHVEKAFRLRLQDTVQQNERLSRSGAAAAAQEKRDGAISTSLPAASTTPTVPVENGKHSTKTGAAAAAAGVAQHATASAAQSSSVAPSGDAAAADTAALLHADAVFSLAEVEKRVDRIAVAVENMPTGGASGRGGQRKH